MTSGQLLKYRNGLVMPQTITPEAAQDSSDKASRRQGGSAVAFSRPRYDMFSGNQIVEEMDGRLRHLRLVEELDH